MGSSLSFNHLIHDACVYLVILKDIQVVDNLYLDTYGIIASDSIFLVLKLNNHDL
jgi:hypothetical protein